MSARKRTLPVQMPAPLEPEAFALAMQSFRDDDPRWRAIHQLLAEDIVTATDRACDKRTAEHPGAMAHAAGGLSWLLDFRDKLIEERNKAKRTQSDGPQA